MHATLVAEFESIERLLSALELVAGQRQSPCTRSSIWLRQKSFPTEALQLDRVQAAAASIGLGLSYSWCHRAAAPPTALLHIPDDEAARRASIGRRRILSCHQIDLAEALLAANPSDQVLLSPWREPTCKPMLGEPLPRAETTDLIRRFHRRITLLGGLHLDDLEAFGELPVAGIALLGPFVNNPVETLLAAP